MWLALGWRIKPKRILEFLFGISAIAYILGWKKGKDNDSKTI
jgi:hypothetical protein